LLRTLLFLFLSLLLLLLPCNAISDEGKILLHIKEMDWIDKHNVLNNWNSSDENPCGWNGVFCNIGFNVVTKVNLSNTSIAGRLTPTICGLQNLTELDPAIERFPRSISRWIVGLQAFAHAGFVREPVRRKLAA
jgi:hypothetical protein